jgi:glycosyltransferase involved in cell wall biosynthesis
MVAMRVGYFTSYYPATSHTFIRREIHALESQSVEVVRYALRPDPQGLVDPEDIVEEKKTKYIFRAGITEILRCLGGAVVRQPFGVLRMISTAIKLGIRSDRGVTRHIPYAVEAIILAEWCLRDGVQHLHVHFGTNPTVVGMLAHKLTGIPFSFTAHGSEEFEKAPLLALDVKLSNAAFAVCVSSFGRSQLMRWSPPELWPKIALVHCGVNDAFLKAAVRPPPSAPRLVCVGRIGEHKGQLVLVAAARRLKAENLEFQIVLVGDGPMRPMVEAEIRRLGLESHITITGWVGGERVRSEMMAARAFILPSFSENMPVVIMEALALGRPAISTYIAGIPELIQPDKSGWLVPSGDDEALAEAMKLALSASVEQLAEMGAAGRAHILERHDALREAMKLKALFAGVLEEPQTKPEIAVPSA